jgi:CreA protein
MRMCIRALVLAVVLGSSSLLSAEEIGSVDTKFKFLTPDHSIKVEVFDDPDIDGISCYLSRAKKGGIKGALGIAEDTSDASIECRQVGPIVVKGEIKYGARVFRQRRSLLFKKLQVVRFVDQKRNVVVYLSYSDRVIEGSPENSITSVPILPWPEAQAPRISVQD